MKNILNDLNELIYVADFNTYELLFINKAAMAEVKKDNPPRPNEKCYEYLYDRSEPCPTCTNCKLKKNQTFEWETFSPFFRKNFILKEKLLDWNIDEKTTVLSKMVIAQDITEERLTFEQISRTAKTESFIINCIKILHQNTDLEVNINTLLDEVGTFVNSDRTYIYTFNFNNNTMTTTHEWCSDDVEPTSPEYQTCSIDVIERWMKYFRSNDFIFIDNIEEIKDYPYEYEMLIHENIHSLIAVPLQIETGELVGFFGIDNASSKYSIQHIQLICKTLSFFIISMLERQLIERKLELQSYTDSLTEINNRNKFTLDIKTYQSNPIKNFGICYIDMNGLKEVNDNIGHSAGDKMLISIANILIEEFGISNSYRIGGDEFVVLYPNSTEEEFFTKVEALHNFSGKGNHPYIAIGAKWYSQITNLDRALKFVDKIMYEDKNRYYIDNKIDRRKY